MKIRELKSFTRTITTETIYKLLEDKFNAIDKRLDKLGDEIQGVKSEFKEEIHQVQNIMNGIQNSQLQIIQILTQLLTTLANKK